VDNETAWSAGLSCGGRVRVVVEPWSQIAGSFEAGLLERTLASGRPFALVTALEESASEHRLFFPEQDQQDAGAAALPEDIIRRAFEARATGEFASDDRQFFVHVFAPKPRLVIVGGSDIAVSLVALAGTLGFETIVVDPRGVFVRPERFSSPPDRMIEAWPQEALPQLPLDADTFAVLLTHDPKIDDPALHILLDRPVPYIGALGGTRTQEKRRERLTGAGFDARQIGRIHGPVGLDIDAATPAEIALSILAEIIAVRNGKAAP
jgi:xanthine dehydrogenase accessory factor